MLGYSSSLFMFFVFVCVRFCVSRWSGCITATNISSGLSTCDYACIFLYACGSVCNLIPWCLFLQHLLLSFVAESRSPWVNWLQSHMTEDMPTRYSSACVLQITDCISYHRRSSEGFRIDSCVCVVRYTHGQMGVVVLTSPTGLKRLTHALTTSHVCMGPSSPICLASVLLTHSGNLQCLSFSTPASLGCLSIFLFVFTFLVCLSIHLPSCNNSNSHPITHTTQRLWLSLIEN